MRHLAELADALPLQISLIDRDLVYVFVNKTYSEWLGEPRERVVGRHVRDVLGDAALAVIQPRLEAALAGETVRFEAEVPYERGGTRYVLATYSPRYAEDGLVRGALTFEQDITDRRRAELALASSERELHAIFQLCAMGLAQGDARTGRILRVNHRLCQITGFTEAELLERRWTDLTHPEDRHLDQDLLEAMARGELSTWEVHKRYLRKDGGTAWVVISGKLVRDEAGRPERAFISVRDFTGQRQAEDALRESRAMLEASQRMAHVGSWVLSLADVADVNGNPLEWSDESFRIFGYEPGSVEVTNELFFGHVHPDDRAAIQTALARALQDGVPYQIEHRIVLLSGEERVVNEWAVPERDASGKPLRMLGTCQDITERKRAEQALRDADRRKDEFLATLSHELRNPLAPIRLGVTLMKGRMRGAPDLGVARPLEIIDRQVGHMARLLDDLLDVSRISRNKLELRKERVELEAVLRSALETSQPLLDTSAHHVSLSLPPEPIELEADPLRLAQVFSNLLNNSAKYTERGGRIEIIARKEREDVVVSVRDTGIGIAPDALPRIFEMFSQAKPALERSQGGLGIGLALVRGLVEMHGGRIEARSEGLGKGTEMVVRLPSLGGAA